MELQDAVPRRPQWETWELGPEEAAALVAAVQRYGDETEDGSPEWEAIRPILGLFVADGVPEIRLQVRDVARAE